MSEGLDPETKVALDWFVRGAVSGSPAALKKAAKFLFMAAREAPMPSNEEDARGMLRVFARRFNKAAKAPG